MRRGFADRRVRRHLTLVAAALAGAMTLAPAHVSAENLLDFLFGGLQRQQAHQGQSQPGLFDPFGLNQQQPQQAAPAARVAGSGPAFCVRSCDGKYFPLTLRGSATPVQLCQAFCPATATKVFYGGSIDYATSSTGERYADSENAFAYRKSLRADCTCNGRDPAGLAPVDLTLDSSLRAGDVVATADGLVAYTGVRVGNNQSADFTPVASYPGLTAELRARLGEMKVAPVAAETVGEAPQPDTSHDPAAPVSVVPKSAAPKAKRAEVN
ncbi:MULTISPECIES: DUF2865 domain-containing protein [Bradyrhizobium]|uniref:DUF2865 domain-containing protein n=1 Tax=Bradyrhizobium elkanii TaxID=29448 RepID=UPI003D9AD141